MRLAAIREAGYSHDAFAIQARAKKMKALTSDRAFLAAKAAMTEQALDPLQALPLTPPDVPDFQQPSPVNASANDHINQPDSRSPQSPSEVDRDEKADSFDVDSQSKTPSTMPKDQTDDDQTDDEPIKKKLFRTRRSPRTDQQKTVPPEESKTESSVAPKRPSKRSSGECLFLSLFLFSFCFLFVLFVI